MSLNEKQDPTDAAEFLLAQREEVYGNRKENMRRTALMWSGFLGVTIHDWQVPIMMSLYKMYRLGVTPDYSDNIDDVDGWNKMFREILGDDLIQARTVEEYLTLKHGPATPVPREERKLIGNSPYTSEDLIQITDNLRVELGELSPGEDEAFRDALHDSQFPPEYAEDAPDTASSEGRAMDEFTLRRQAKLRHPSSGLTSEFLHRYHKLNNEGDEKGPDKLDPDSPDTGA